MSEAKGNPPPITEPTKRAGHEIEKGWPHLKAAPLAVASVAVVAFLMGFLLAWNIVVAGKNTTIETLTTASKEKDSKIDQLQKEDDKLQKQNRELNSALAEFNAPLKKRALILATQLTDFARPSQSDSERMNRYYEFQNRFERRINDTVAQLDEVGQHSDLLNHLAGILMNALLNDPSGSTNLTVIAKELARLANNLKE
jgi:predicted RNase H-like nuclease (RuvC/YqgF family)